MLKNAIVHRSVRCWLAAGAGLLIGSFAFAASAEEVDMAKAKAEGKLVWYTSTAIGQANNLALMFEKQTGIKVELFRSGGSAILRRFMQEASAGKIAADVMTMSDPAAADQLSEKGTFVAFKPKDFDKITETARNKDGYWIAQRLNAITIYMRGDKVPPAERPKKWTDLTDAKYDGKLVMTDPSFTSVQLTTVGVLADKYGWDYYEKLNDGDIMIVQGNQQVADNIKRGERLIAVGALDVYIAADRRNGHDFVSIYPEDGTLLIPSPTGIIKGGPHPNAAKAFAEFMISPEAQKTFPETGEYSARVDMAPPAGNPKVDEIKLMPVDYEKLETQAAEIKEKFNDIFR
ncbi:extracellular solute-binding protein family 1 [Ancylobacter novellus DSM 506]|uniref:Extracellular solute-binding protein family 1 n=1 Tax=Ancylobacter novellus (strain ATCC 8093 / DSM 506 / JCM 20403 / CCM 1077 / IAM 12100 / NBRC 12443 / NCIMB 10456) TaxID=639283 RepID=D7A431_ANCN5|nr:ABC transporter substrate-binding protein [Ancylobacter novellus]ADH87851.1 extracellular solute-binding protein family 1 [Ancylobacter novellus DSM 506]